tara:strand:+ start:343 stop:783 length:441 start_codon:yes stop_codon:yes gene_type:complete
MNLNTLDEDKLLEALGDDENKCLLNLTTSKIKSIKNDVLQQLSLDREDLIILHDKLCEYRYVDEIPDVKYGCYIRWIRLKNPDEIKLTNGGVVIDVSVMNDDIYLTCKNNRNRMFKLKMSENIIFQKLTEQEKILLSVLDYVNDKN